MKEKRCRHKWDIYKDVTLMCGGNQTHRRTTKICRKCGEKRVKEKLNWF